MMRRVLIIGHGLVGACLAQRFSEKGCEVTIYDRPQKDSASRVAAGLITPITGKGMNPSERVADFFDEAVEFFGSNFYTETGVLRLFANEKERAKFQVKAEREDIAPWCLNEVGKKPEDPILINLFGGFEMSGGWVNTAKFLDARKLQWIKNEAGIKFISEDVSATELQSLKGRYDLVLICRGAFEFTESEATFLQKTRSGTHRSAKGEILTIRIPDFREKRIINRNGWLMPYDSKKNLYRAGATFEWDELNVNTTVKGRELIENKIRSLIHSPFEVVDHQAGIRPIVRKSQPFIEALDEKSYVINGFGSKGTLYAPKVTREFAEHILEGSALSSWYSL